MKSFVSHGINSDRGRLAAVLLSLASLCAAQNTAPKLQTEAQWRYELASRVIDRQPIPELRQDPDDVYAELNAERFRSAKTFIEARVALLEGATPVPLVGIIDAGEEKLPQVLCLVFRQLHFQAQVIAAGEDLSQYPLVVLGAIEDLPESQWSNLENYVRGGGTLLTSIKDGLASRATWEYWGEALWERTYSFFGFHVTGRAVGGHNGYLQLEPKVRRSAVDRGCLIKGPFWEVLPLHADKLGKLILPWQNLSYGFAYMQAPPDQESLYPGVVSTNYGKGKIVFATLPVFYALRSTGFTCIQDELADLTKYLIPDQPFRMEGPPNLEASLLSRGDGLLLNLLYYYPNRPVTTRLEIEESLPLRNVAVEVRCSRRPQSVTLLPEGTKLNFDYLDGYAKVMIPSLSDWQVLGVNLSKQ